MKRVLIALVIGASALLAIEVAAAESNSTKAEVKAEVKNEVKAEVKEPKKTIMYNGVLHYLGEPIQLGTSKGAYSQDILGVVPSKKD